VERVDKALQDVSASYMHERHGKSVAAPDITSLPYGHVVWPSSDIITMKPKILLSVAPVTDA